MVLTLYKLDASPPARSVLMTIAALKIPDVELVDVNLLEKEHFKEDFIKLNPQHTVPTLKDDDFVIWDSHAISCYLANNYAKNDVLYPEDPKMRALIDQRLHFDSGILFPALRGAAEKVIFFGEKTFRPEALERIQSAYDFTESFLTSPWLVGNDVTLADICCVSSISSMDIILPIDENKYPNIIAWLQRCSQLEYYKTMNKPGLEQFAAILKSKLE